MTDHTAVMSKTSAMELAESVPLLDIVRENGPLQQQLQGAAIRVLESGQYIFGPDCKQLELQLAARCRVDFSLGCASGSDALLLALMAIETGPGDEVIVPSFTFFATASAVSRLGARPVFVDIDPVTFCLNPDAVAQAITPRTKAVIPVHLFGQCAEMRRLDAIARENELFLIEDAAQSIDARCEDRPAGSWGHIGCFSFYPTKNLGGCGDGGMLTTSDSAIADQLELLRAHGMRPRYHHQVIGINSRLDSMQAALLLVKLQHLSSWTDARRLNAERYQQLFDQYQLGEHLVVPEAGNGYHVWNQFTIRVLNGQRDALRSYLASHRIGSEVYYPIPLHQQECYAELRETCGPLPETERAAREVLSLPIFPGLTSVEQETVVARIAKFCRS